MQDGEPLLFDATLKPNPPMPPWALKLVLCIVAGVNLAFGIFFMSRGAWVVTPFMGVDVAVLAWAFHASVRASRRLERVKLTPRELMVEKHPPKGPVSAVALNPYWVRVEIADPPEAGSQLRLTSHGRSVALGAFLAPYEKLSLAKALRAALLRAREMRA